MQHSTSYLHRTALAAALIIAAILSFSCENKRDHNGDLGGMWQLTECRDADGAPVHEERNQMIYYSIQLNLIKFKWRNDINYKLAYFTHTPDSLIIYRPVDYEKDSVVDISALHTYGVPADGRFHVDHLSSDRLQLSSQEGTLLFRKY